MNSTRERIAGTLTQSHYIPRQMNGPVVNAYATAVEADQNNVEAVAQYLHDLSIDTAQETELENIGKIIGYPRPLVPEGFNAENILLLGTLPISTDELLGLSTTDSEIGGQLSGLQVSGTYFMSLDQYRSFLKKIAIVKRKGLTLKTVDQIAALIAQDYTITIDENADINIHYEQNIGYKNIWLLTKLFYRIATEPQVIITAG